VCTPAADPGKAAHRFRVRGKIISELRRKILSSCNVSPPLSTDKSYHLRKGKNIKEPRSIFIVQERKGENGNEGQ
jgi:hypothetical protein